MNSNLIIATYDLSNFKDKFITFLEVSYRFNNNFIYANIDKEELLKNIMHLKIQLLFLNMIN